MEKQIKELSCKTLLVDVSEYPLNFLIFPHRLTANSYIGCLHNCAYCYARWYCKQDELRVKVNAPEILRKELQNRIKKGKPKEPVCFGSISDPYQPIETKYHLTHKMLQVCDELNYPVFIVTKSHLVQNDLHVLSSLASKNLVEINFTITPVATKLLRKLEPYAPTNHQRLEALKKLTKAGVPCNLYLSPIFPRLSSKFLNYYVETAAQNGAKCCSAVFLKIRPIIWNGVKPFLQANAPSLIVEYEDLYFKRGSKDLSGYWLPEITYRRKTMASIAGFCKLNNLCFTAEEFLDLWTTDVSDCVNVGWYAPTAFEIVKFIKSQKPKQVTVDEAIDFIKNSYIVDKKWEKLMRKYWDKAKLLI